jgi:hypothetical protein
MKGLHVGFEGLFPGLAQKSLIEGEENGELGVPKSGRLGRSNCPSPFILVGALNTRRRLIFALASQLGSGGGHRPTGRTLRPSRKKQDTLF